MSTLESASYAHSLKSLEVSQGHKHLIMLVPVVVTRIIYHFLQSKGARTISILYVHFPGLRRSDKGGQHTTAICLVSGSRPSDYSKIQRAARLILHLHPFDPRASFEQSREGERRAVCYLGKSRQKNCQPSFLLVLASPALLWLNDRANRVTEYVRAAAFSMIGGTIRRKHLQHP